MNKKAQRRKYIKTRVRNKISGTPRRPHLSVFRNDKQIHAQVIDGIEGRTLASASPLKMETSETKKEVAARVEQGIARVALAASTGTVVFSRNGYLYHGRVRELADAAHTGGLKF